VIQRLRSNGCDPTATNGCLDQLSVNPSDQHSQTMDNNMMSLFEIDDDVKALMEDTVEIINNEQTVWHPRRNEYVIVNTESGEIRSPPKPVQLEEGEVLEDGCVEVCSGFYFDMNLKRRLPGCIDCYNGSCKRVNR
jgi:hypothetical protein